jgi:hypothetical protein
VVGQTAAALSAQTISPAIRPKFPPSLNEFSLSFKLMA